MTIHLNGCNFSSHPPANLFYHHTWCFKLHALILANYVKASCHHSSCTYGWAWAFCQRVKVHEIHYQFLRFSSSQIFNQFTSKKTKFDISRLTSLSLSIPPSPCPYCLRLTVWPGIDNSRYMYCSIILGGEGAKQNFREITETAIIQCCRSKRF